MANIIYESVINSGRLPTSGSLREALLLTVWLRRQEIELAKSRILMAGFSDRFSDSNKATIDAYKDYIGSIFPFAARHQEEEDQKLIENVRKAAESGVLHFSVATLKPLQKAGKNFTVPDDFKERLRNKRNKK